LLRAYLRGLLYIGRGCAGPTAGLAAWLAAGLTAGCAAGAVGVADRARALRAVLRVLIVWFNGFLALYRLARALIRQRPWLIARQ
jgi:hypothetical protein